MSSQAVDAGRIQAAELLLPCPSLNETLAFFTEQLGFRVAMIYPADQPEVAVVTGHGLRVRLDARWRGDPGSLRLLSHAPERVAGGLRHLVAPNGTRIDIVDADAPMVVPPLQSSLVVTRASGDALVG